MARNFFKGDNGPTREDVAREAARELERSTVGARRSAYQGWSASSTSSGPAPAPARPKSHDADDDEGEPETMSVTEMAALQLAERRGAMGRPEDVLISGFDVNAAESLRDRMLNQYLRRQEEAAVLRQQLRRESVVATENTHPRPLARRARTAPAKKTAPARKRA